VLMLQKGRQEQRIATAIARQVIAVSQERSVRGEIKIRKNERSATCGVPTYDVGASGTFRACTRQYCLPVHARLYSCFVPQVSAGFWWDMHWSWSLGTCPGASSNVV
jgi:hypothetical protein